MKISGTHTFAATRDEVWSAINDPEVLARTIPGCQKLEQVGENEFESTLKIGLQAIKGVYNGRVRLEDVQQPAHYKIALDGKGNNGFVQGEGTVDLAEEGGSTKLTYTGDAQVGGTIASVGQRLIDGAAKTLINQSLKALAAQIEARRQPSDSAATDAPSPALPDGSSSNGSSDDAATDVPPPALPDGSSSDRPVSDEEVTVPPDEAVSEDSNARAKTVVAALEAEQAAAAGDSEQALMADTTPSSPTAMTTAVAQPASQPDKQSAAPAPFERRSIVVPEGEGLSDADVARGVVVDFFTERPWLPWVVVAFLLGYILGRERS